MFIKEAYDQRLKLEDGNSHHKHSKPPIVGSIKNDKMNYDRDEQFFSKDDVPPKARTIKDSVKNLIDPDHLGLRKKHWNASVSVPKKLQAEQTHQQRLLKIKVGFLDHPLPKYKEPKIHSGTDTRDDYTNWNVSNQVSRKEINENLAKTTMSAFENTKIKQKNYLKEYNDPFNKTNQFITGFRKEWESKQALRRELRDKYVFDNPTASEQKINGAVFRLTYETAIKKKKDDIEARAMKTDFRATLSDNQKKLISVQFYHTGVWECSTQKIGSEVEKVWVWSCCLNEDKKSPGCSRRLKDKNRWNLTSFNA